LADSAIIVLASSTLPVEERPLKDVGGESELAVLVAGVYSGALTFRRVLGAPYIRDVSQYGSNKTLTSNWASLVL